MYKVGEQIMTFQYLYESDPKTPDPSEIAKVTDYVVNYACKGNLTLAVEKKKQVKDFTLRLVYTPSFSMFTTHYFPKIFSLYFFFANVFG